PGAHRVAPATPLSPMGGGPNTAPRAGGAPADAAGARTATKEPVEDDDDKTAAVRPLSSAAPAPAAAAPAPAPKSSAGSKGVASNRAGTATAKVATPAASPPASVSERYAAAGRGAPAKTAAADQLAQAPRDPDTMAIVRTPARPSGSDNGRDSGARDSGARDDRGRTGAADRGAEARTVAAVGAASVAADPDRTVVDPAVKPNLAKSGRGPAVPAERMPTPAPGARTTAPGERGREQRAWARPGRGGSEPAAGYAGRPDTDRPEPARAGDYPADYGDPDGSRTGRRARLRLTRVSPLTVTRLAFAFSLCLFLVIMVAVAVLWFVLNSVGVFNSITDAAGTLTSGESHSVSSWLSFGRAMQISLLVGAINVVLLTLLATLGAMLYNLCADMIGGIEVTLSDR
ncbi:DUF3566 domain-containing protein, partial [Frankia sp. AgB1.8]|uniref:DUF3566 domain-containing protein n=1 Tax=Frankia sp. AgB1.8 TaxID=2792839 RepID=UPI001EE43743